MRNRALFCRVLFCLVCYCLSSLGVSAAWARDNIQIVGSSTLYPFITVVAERFGKSTDFNTPIVESTGTGGGMKLFCAGIGAAHPDFANASRRIKPSEFAQCQSNGVRGIIEVKIGYDGIVLANNNQAARLTLSRRDIFLALARQVPNPDGSESLVANPYTTWADVNPSLPPHKIEVLGPPPTSGTRDAFVELAMQGGCVQFAWLKAQQETDPNAFKSTCHEIREDGAFIESGENDNLIVQKLGQNPTALGIFGFSFLEQNNDVVQGSLVDGVAPEFEAIADGTYPIARPLYVYGKAAQIGVIAGMAEFLAELTAEQTYGDDGYLSDRGLIPLPPAQRQQYRAAAEERIEMVF